jgi:hypothetical protein
MNDEQNVMVITVMADSFLRLNYFLIADIWITMSFFPDEEVRP